jgi:hypothetical protein
MSTISTVVTSTIFSPSNNDEFSLLHDEDDEEDENLRSKRVSTTSSSTATRDDKDDDADELPINNSRAISTHDYQSIEDQAIKWITKLEQIRDTTTWYHVENAFLLDRLYMIGITGRDGHETTELTVDLGTSNNM